MYKLFSTSYHRDSRIYSGLSVTTLFFDSQTNRYDYYPQYNLADKQSTKHLVRIRA